MRVIRGTGDSRRMAKGNTQVSTTRTLRCMNCGGQAMPTVDPAGVVSYACPRCKTNYKTQRM